MRDRNVRNAKQIRLKMSAHFSPLKSHFYMFVGTLLPLAAHKCFRYHLIAMLNCFTKRISERKYIFEHFSPHYIMRVSAASPRGRPPGNPRATQGLGRGFVAKACPTRGALERFCVFGKIPRGHTHGIYT